MSDNLNCPGCAAPVRVPEGMAGKRARCPQCQMIFTVPTASAAPAKAAASSPQVDLFKDANRGEPARRESKKSVARKHTAARKTAQAAPRKAKRGYDIRPGQPTGREVQAMHRLQVLTERYIGEGLTPADARTRRHERLMPNPRAGADHTSDYQGPFGGKITLVT